MFQLFCVFVFSFSLFQRIGSENAVEGSWGVNSVNSMPKDHSKGLSLCHHFEFNYILNLYILSTCFVRYRSWIVYTMYNMAPVLLFILRKFLMRILAFPLRLRYIGCSTRITSIVEFDWFNHAHLSPKSDAVIGVIGIELFQNFCCDSFLKSSLLLLQLPCCHTCPLPHHHYHTSPALLRLFMNSTNINFITEFMQTICLRDQWVFHAAALNFHQIVWHKRKEHRRRDRQLLNMLARQHCQ